MSEDQHPHTIVFCSDIPFPAETRQNGSEPMSSSLDCLLGVLPDGVVTKHAFLKQFLMVEEVTWSHAAFSIIMASTNVMLKSSVGFPSSMCVVGFIRVAVLW